MSIIVDPEFLRITDFAWLKISDYFENILIFRRVSRETGTWDPDRKLRRKGGNYLGSHSAYSCVYVSMCV